MTKPRQLGRALTIVAAEYARRMFIDSDLAAFHAPSECYKDAHKGDLRRERIARRKAKSISGLNRRQFRLILKANDRTICRAAERIAERDYHI